MPDPIPALKVTSDKSPHLLQEVTRVVPGVVPQGARGGGLGGVPGGAPGGSNERSPRGPIRSLIYRTADANVYALWARCMHGCMRTRCSCSMVHLKTSENLPPPQTEGNTREHNLASPP